MATGTFIINNNTYKAQTLVVAIESLADEDSGRTEDGVMHINWIFKKIRKVTITMPPSPIADIQTLLSSIHGEYSLTYDDPLDGTKTINCYTSNSTSTLYSAKIKNGLWQGVSFSAIEISGEN